MIISHILIEAIPFVLFILLVGLVGYKFAKMLCDGLDFLVRIGEHFQRHQDYINSEGNNCSHLNLPARIHEDFNHVYDEDNSEYKLVILSITHPILNQ